MRSETPLPSLSSADAKLQSSSGGSTYARERMRRSRRRILAGFISVALFAATVIAAFLVLRLKQSDSLETSDASTNDPLPQRYVNFSQGFACDENEALVLNSQPNTPEFPQLIEELDPNSGIPTGVCFVRLANATLAYTASSMFVPFAFSSHRDFSFTMKATYRMFGGHPYSPGDGLAFIVHQDMQFGARALGGSGGALGVYGNQTKQALVIELDTCT